MPVHFSFSVPAWRVYGVTINLTSCAWSFVLVMELISTALLSRGPPVAGVTVTPAGASVTYLNFTARVGTEGLVRVILTWAPLQIVSCFGVTVIRAVGSTHTYAVSFMPVHFSFSDPAWREYGVTINLTSCAWSFVLVMVFVRMSLLFKPVPVAGDTVTPAGASVTYRNFTAGSELKDWSG